MIKWVCRLSRGLIKRVRRLSRGLIKRVRRLNGWFIHRSGVVFNRLREGIRGDGMLIGGLVKRIGRRCGLLLLSRGLVEGVGGRHFRLLDGLIKRVGGGSFRLIRGLVEGVGSRGRFFLSGVLIEGVG